MAMIKCPECGESVSTMAHTCPHCGVGIKGHLRECPMCGEWILDNQTRCPECNSVVEVKPQSDQDSSSGYDKGNQDKQDNKGKQENQGKKKSSNTILWVLVFMVPLISIGAAWAITSYLDYKDAADRRQFEEELEERRMEEERRNKEFAEIQRKDSLDWVYAQEVNTVASMDRYLQLHPQGNYMDEAMMKRETLKRTEVTKEDRSHIRNILESRLTEAATSKPTAGDIIGIHYQISGDLSITKEQTTTGSVQFYAKCKVSETISRTDPTKPTDSTFVLRAILDIDKNVLEINL
ncbi:MAG: zinc ribbon domain-containing protein [Bacteroidaceae bacterium]|nr:zinc ribbon domain-containing protein [Bacteroidaceae bacterium]